ncbi:MAG: hypothetical protein ACRD8A_06500 [Candidatus Acidiferrales bacterium]
MNAVLQIQEILATRGLTLHRVSLRSADLFGGSSPFYVPHNLYHRMSHASFRPTIHQVLALSHVSGYQLCDWLAVLGFDLDAVSRAQLLVPRRSTTVLDSAVYHRFRSVPWLAERAGSEDGSSTAPLGHLVRWGEPRRIADLLAPDARRFVYARVGEADIYARPQFVRGSIVRADTTRASAFAIEEASASGNRFFLVEHRSGWTCARLTPVAKNRVVLDCPQHPCAERELRLDKDIRVIGIIDAEIRPVARRGTERQPVCALLPSAESGQDASAPTSLRDLLIQSRRRAGLSYREASSLSRSIAKILSDPLYFAAPGTLSDYETLDAAPRHIQKILTICILYCIGFPAFLRACGLPLDRAGRDPVPDQLLPREFPNRNHGLPRAKTPGPQEPNGFLSSIVTRWQEIPLFLRFSLGAITGMKGLSLSDFFWVAGNDLCDPFLQNGALAVVNRRAKRPGSFDPAATSGLPLYLLLKRDGGYVCGRCSLDRDIVRLHSYARAGKEPEQFGNDIDVEIVGQVTAIARLL